MSAFSSSPLSGRIRPSSEVYFNQSQQSQNQNQNQNNAESDANDRAAQQWLVDIDQYETTLDEMAAATLDQDFKDELSAIEQWFRVLSEAERTAALYALLQQTTQVQIRFFIMVLQQMAKSHPMSGVLSPANFEKDPMSNRLSDAMKQLSVEGSRNSYGRPPPSPSNKRNSGLDQPTVYAMFPDAAAGIATQRAKFTQQTGNAPGSNRNSSVFDNRPSSLVAPTISAPADSGKDNLPQPPSSPWGPRSNDQQQPIQRPKSSSDQQPMGQFAQPPPSAGLRSPRNQQMSGNLQTTTVNIPDQSNLDLPVLSPYNAGNGSWASMTNTPMVPSFNQVPASQADMVANATAMKLAALSTVNNRIALDDVKKYRRSRTPNDGQGNVSGQGPVSPGFMANTIPGTNIVMVNEHGQVVGQQQAAAFQVQQNAALAGRRSRPSSPGLALQGAGWGGMGFTSPQNNGFLAAYDGQSPLLNGATGLSLGQYAIGHVGGPEGYLSDHSDVMGGRGRSPRGRRGSSKPPEDPTDPSLLQDIPQWLRSLRLHKYTDNLKDLNWTQLIELDDDALEKRGVNALGARRKMLKVFEQVKEARSDGKL
ncbi:MAG: Flap-structured DNA-binding and RNA-binding protein [Geoglossum umbratile]|nr:MAG: Flap-structured DNA-binding and RNA-binding protein [Geoglossum umbratile]